MTGYNPADEGAQMSFAKDMSYTDYLSLDPILGAQNCKSCTSCRRRAPISRRVILRLR